MEASPLRGSVAVSTPSSSSSLGNVPLHLASSSSLAPLSSSSSVDAAMSSSEKEQIDKHFENVLAELGLPAAKAAQMRDMPYDRKKIMVQQYLDKQENNESNGTSNKKSKRKSTSSKDGSALNSPEYYINELRNGLTTGQWSIPLVSSLRVSLIGNVVSWINKFIEIQGFIVILDMLRYIDRRGDKTSDEETIEVECILCLKGILNTQNGMEQLLTTPDAVKTIVLHINTKNEKAKEVLFDLLSAVCMIPGLGHRLTLDALTHFSIVKREKVRFATIADMLLNHTKYKQQTIISVLTFVNTIVNSPDNINTRVRLRKEFQLLLMPVISQNLRLLKDLDIDQLLDVYEEESEEDNRELLEQVMELGVNVNDIMDMSSYLKKNISSEALPYFKACLKNFLRFPEQNAGVKCWVLADHLLEEIAAQKENISLNDETKFSLQQIISSFEDKERYVASENKVHTLQTFVNMQQQQINLLQKQLNMEKGTRLKVGTAVDHRRCKLETAKTQQMFEDALDAINKEKNKKLDQLEKKVDHLTKKLAHKEKELEKALEKAKKAAEAAATAAISHAAAVSALKLTEGTLGTTVVAETSTHPAPVAPKAPVVSEEAHASTVASHPPPLPSKPPPPPPVNLSKISAPSAPAAPAPPAPPAPAPPPPPGGKGVPPPPAFSKQVLALPSKPPVKTSVKMRQLQWTKIPNMKIATTIWMGLSDQNVEIDSSELEKQFAAPVSAPRTGGFRPKISVITLIETKRANNTAIMLSRFKIPYEEVKTAILEADEEKLPIDKLGALLQFSPTVEEMTLIRDFTGDRDKLGVAEKFFSVMMTIPRYKQKLEALMAKATFSSQAKDIKELVSVILAATKEVYENEKLAKLLEIVLAVGNYLNSNTARGMAYGFTLSSINALTDTKSTDNKITLLHYLIKHLEAHYPDIISVPDSMPHIKPATRVAYQSLLKDIAQLKSDLEKIAKEIPQCEEGRLKDVLTNWLEDATQEYVEIEQSAKEMEASFAKLCIAFGEESKTMQPDTLFNMLLKFLTNFDKAMKDNQRVKAMAEREAARKAKAALSPKKKKEGKETEDGVVDKLIATVRDGDVWRQRRMGLHQLLEGNSTPSTNAAITI